MRILLQAFFHPAVPISPAQFSHFPKPVCTETAPRPTKRRAPRKFVRLKTTKSGTLLQTAVTTYTSPEKTLHIHSLLHLAESDYYHSLTSPAETVLYELITHSNNTTPPPRRLKTTISATPSARVAARRLDATAQADALDARQPGWFIADVPSDQLPHTDIPPKPPENAFLRVISSLLPCPELNLLAQDLSGTTPTQILQLLKSSFLDKRKLLYAWRCEKSCARAAMSSSDRTTVLRDRTAWRSVDDARGEVALLYGAWHSGRFCRMAEDCGMAYVRKKWVTAMTVPNVCVEASDWGVWGIAGVLYCYLAGWDWVSAIESGLIGHFTTLATYLIRHGLVYFVVRQWLRELE